jgi:hypothetical protein
VSRKTFLEIISIGEIQGFLFDSRDPSLDRSAGERLARAVIFQKIRDTGRSKGVRRTSSAMPQM